MNFPKNLDKTFLTLILIHSIACNGFLLKNNIKKSNLISNLLDVLNLSDTEDQFPIKNEMANKYNKKAKLRDIFTNKILVKRLVPHGHGISNYQYDPKYNSIYRPLARLHGGKPRLIEKERNKFENGPPPKLPKSVRDVRYTDEELLQPFQALQPRKVTFKSILEDVASYVLRVNSASDKRRLKYAILELLENDPKTLLRHRFATGSEERAIENSAKMFFQDQGHVTEPPKKKWRPNFSYWNYWKYDKPVYQDICKGKLLQMGNVCMETPPH